MRRTNCRCSGAVGPHPHRGRNDQEDDHGEESKVEDQEDQKGQKGRAGEEKEESCRQEERSAEIGRQEGQAQGRAAHARRSQVRRSQARRAQAPRAQARRSQAGAHAIRADDIGSFLGAQLLFMDLLLDPGRRPRQR